MLNSVRKIEIFDVLIKTDFEYVFFSYMTTQVSTTQVLENV